MSNPNDTSPCVGDPLLPITRLARGHYLEQSLQDASEEPSKLMDVALDKFSEGENMSFLRAPGLPPEHVAFLKRDPVKNLYILNNLQRSGRNEYLFDPRRPESGVLEICPVPDPEGVYGHFSVGNAEAQSEIARSVAAPGTKGNWLIPEKALYDVMISAMQVTSDLPVLTYSRQETTRLPQGTARLLGKEDIPLLADQRPHLARALAREERRWVAYGVIENGEWISDCTASPTYDRYWLIGNLFTCETHRRLGYAKAAVSACLNHILGIGMIPLYETYEPNVPSIRTAESCGMSLISRTHQCGGVMR